MPLQPVQQEHLYMHIIFRFRFLLKSCLSHNYILKEVALSYFHSQSPLGNYSLYPHPHQA